MSDTEPRTERIQQPGLEAHAAPADTDEDGPLVVRGVALGEGPAQGTVNADADEEDAPTIYSPEVLEAAADKLVGRPIVDDRDHDPNDAAYDPQNPANENIIGEVTQAKPKPGVGIAYQGEVDRSPERELIENGRVDVSPTVLRSTGEYDDALGGKPAEEIAHFRDLAVVPDGGSPDASIEPATNPAEALQAEALAATFGGDESAEALAATQIHAPSYTSTTTGDWSAPSLSDFDTDDLSAIDDHFLVSVAGFPPENFSDLALPVVSTGGTLNKTALSNAKSRAGQVTGLSGEDLSRVRTKIDNLANEEFNAGFGDAEANARARARSGAKAANGETAAETMADPDNPDNPDNAPPEGSDGGDGGEEQSDGEQADSELTSMSKDELVSMVEDIQQKMNDMRETNAELKGQVKALGGDVEAMEAAIGGVEEHAVEAFAEKHDYEEEFVRENFDTADLIEAVGGPEATAEALGLSPNPRTGDPDPTTEGTTASLGSDEEAEVESLLKRASEVQNWDEAHAESLRENAADIAGVEDPDALEAEVL
jgi:hypothetical protein